MRESKKYDMVIEVSNRVIKEIGQSVTVRQLYYQLVGGGHMENKQTEYQYLVKNLVKARERGHIEWKHIEDRTRKISSQETAYKTPKEMGDIMLNYVSKVDSYYELPFWTNQPRRVIVVVEKQALEGVFQRVCDRYKCPLVICRGYPSATLVKDMASFINKLSEGILLYSDGNNDLRGSDVVIEYFGDHDPSGQDIPRYIMNKLYEFWGCDFTWNWRALTIDQIQKWKLISAPVKSSDSRAMKYVERSGMKSLNGVWELDAIPPKDLDYIIEVSILAHFDPTVRSAVEDIQNKDRKKLKRYIKKNFESVL